MPLTEHRQWSILALSTTAFMVCFAVWTMFSIIGIQIKNELYLNNSEFGLLIATPILSGALSRLPLGLLTDFYGGRSLFLIQMFFVSIICFTVPLCTVYWHYLVVGLFIGLAGGSFAIGIAYTSSWFSRERQGLAMGIFGMGNIGAAITDLVAPLVLLAYGWRMVPQVFGAFLLLTAVIFWLFTFQDPKHDIPDEKLSLLRNQLKPLRDQRVWRFSMYYFVVFGGFVALALWLPRYYIDEFGLSLKTASFITLLFTLPSGLIRALGGWLSDTIGARNINWGVFWVCIVCLFFLSYPPTTMTIHGVKEEIQFNLRNNVWVFTTLIFIMGLAMGFGKASIYRLIHDYYPTQMGTVGGCVGAIGALGGFVLPIIFGLALDITGIRSSCFMFLYGLIGACMLSMYYAIKAEEHLERLRNAVHSDFLRE